MCITLYLPLFLGFIETGAIIGPLIGLSLASFCANVYVDTGSVNTGNSIKSIYTVSKVHKASSGMLSHLIVTLSDPQLDRISTFQVTKLKLRSLNNFQYFKPVRRARYSADLLTQNPVLFLLH